MAKLIKDTQGNYKDSEGFELIDQFDGTFEVLDNKGNDISGEYETLEQGKQTIKDYKKNNKKTISGNMAKLKKGSKAAKDFMAKLRAARKGAKKKKKVSGLKITPKPHKESRLKFGKRGIVVKPIKRKAAPKRKVSGEKHTDIKSHNYKITIGSLKEQNLKEYFQLIENIKRGQTYIDGLKYDIKRYGKGKGSNHISRMADMKYMRKWTSEQKKKLAVIKRLIKNTL